MMTHPAQGLIAPLYPFSEWQTQNAMMIPNKVTVCCDFSVFWGFRLVCDVLGLGAESDGAIEGLLSMYLPSSKYTLQFKNMIENRGMAHVTTRFAMLIYHKI